MHTYLEFERPIAELEGKIVELRKLAEEDPAMQIDAEVGRLQAKIGGDDKGGVVNDLDRTLAGEATAEGAVAERREDCLLSTRSISFESDLSHALYNQGTARLVPHL